MEIIENKNKFIVDESSIPKTPEQIVQAIFGMNLNQLVQEIIINKDSKYDKAYGR